MEFDVSVLLLTYNPELDKLKSSILSVLLQKDISVQLIIADDGSVFDFFPEIDFFLHSYSFKNYKLVKHKNYGTVKNFYSALVLADGKYIKGLGQGDLLYDSYTLYKLSKKMCDDDSSAICCNGASFFLKNKNIIFKNIRMPYSIRAFQIISKLKRNYLLFGDVVNGAATFFKKDILLSYYDTYMKSLSFADDIVLKGFIAKDEPVSFYNIYSIWYRDNDQGISKKKSFSPLIREDNAKLAELLLADPTVIFPSNLYKRSIRSYIIYMREPSLKNLLLWVLYTPGLLSNKLKKKMYNKPHLSHTQEGMDFLNYCIRSNIK